MARNAVDIPNDDMFIRWREHKSEDEKAAQAMMDGAEDLESEVAFNQALKAASQYGTGVVLMVIEGDTMESPLNLRHIREGDLKALHYFDRFDLSVTQWERDIRSPFFLQPTHYMVHPSHGGVPFRVHRSRILRFDGIDPSTRSGFTVYDQDFGVSVLVPIIVSLLEDQTIASAVAHMSQEASIPVLHIAGLREAIAGGADPDEASPEEIGAAVRASMSVFRLLMLDEPGRETYERVAANFGGLKDILETYQHRVASALKIPQTRFLGNPPTGMQATGESDMKNYVMMMEATRSRLLKAPLRRFDEVLARHVGIRTDPPEYEWLSLLELSDQDIALGCKDKGGGAGHSSEGHVDGRGRGTRSYQRWPCVW